MGSRILNGANITDFGRGEVRGARDYAVIVRWVTQCLLRVVRVCLCSSLVLRQSRYHRLHQTDEDVPFIR
jgi:hypothetical protein